ncbi:hypothetical protein PILCRDRAFT_570607 [Piloderma croceum F 1598]|uniref:Uncharacterized protein n=1 Tax=Piloderma croceum (strain F 1598) TaxID=765440 RepID=A0A0C3BPF6_PILCF|nr:hypothetical protein PILCRDRAFT_570607 [Piloderma croceum F 1598]
MTGCGYVSRSTIVWDFLTARGGGGGLVLFVLLLVLLDCGGGPEGSAYLFVFGDELWDWSVTSTRSDERNPIWARPMHGWSWS